MKIKDVEKLTGLSQRSIRLYEEKGLLEVRRDEDNQYRYYSEEDVERLKLIRVLRYFDFSIEEIKDLVTGTNESALTEALSKKADSFADKVDDFEGRSEQCRKLIKEIKRSGETEVLDDYIEMIGALDDEELKELDEWAKQIEHPSIGVTLLWTLIFSGPILTGLLMGVKSKLHILLIAVSSALMAIDWVMYIRGRSRRKEYQKERDKGSIWIFPTLIAGICLSLAAFLLLSNAQKHWLDYTLGDKWVFYEEVSWMTSPLIIAISMMTIYPLFALLHRFTGNEDYEFARDQVIFLKDHILIAFAAAIICIYIGFTGMSAVTDNALVKFDAFHPTGKAIPFKEIESVETGFSKRGDFYYKLSSGSKRTKFSAPYVNELAHPEYYDEDGTVTYQELVDFDEKIMALGIHKIVDADSIRYADYSEPCMQKFKRIMEVQNEEN